MIYTSRFINVISLFLTTIIFLLLNFYIFNNPEIKKEIKITKKVEAFQKEGKDIPQEQKEEENINLGNWYIEIPTINLKAPIEEGTSLEILNRKVGHFEETSTKNGNIGLAAHNRGYEKNYFENLKKLKINDEIFYKNFDFEKIYLVETIEIIKNTDWSYLENTDENKITLITCIENEPQYRRCIQATENE